MATCECLVNNKEHLVMTRALLDDILAARERVTREQTLDQIIELIQSHQNLWFSQSLNIGSGAFWANKAATAQALVTEIRKVKK